MSTSPAQPQNDLPLTTVDALPDNVVMIDVREDDEWAAGHAPHAVHIPMGQIPDRISELPTDATVLVCCRSGGRSGRVVAYLRERGIDAVNVDGGMLAWQEANRPMKHDGPGTPFVN